MVTVLVATSFARCIHIDFDNACHVVVNLVRTDVSYFAIIVLVSLGPNRSDMRALRLAADVHILMDELLTLERVNGSDVIWVKSQPHFLCLFSS